MTNYSLSSGRAWQHHLFCKANFILYSPMLMHMSGFIWAHSNLSVKWQHRHRVYTGMPLLPFLIPNATILWANQNIAHENQAGRCAHGKLHMVLSYFIVLLFPLIKHKPHSGWKKTLGQGRPNASSGSGFCHFLEVWKLLSHPNCPLSLQQVILSAPVITVVLPGEGWVSAACVAISGNHQKRWFWRRSWRYKVILREVKLHK